MLERAQDPAYRAIAEPNAHALMLLDQVLARVPEPLVCEIGVGVGATSLQLCERLGGRGRIHFYDFEHKLDELREDLAARGFTNADYFGNSRKRYDGYGWTLMKRMRAMLAGEDVDLYDLAFLDGAHAFHHDASATALLKEMIAPGGIILFDDFDWSFAVSPTLNPAVQPSIAADYTDEQIEVSHVAMVCECLMDPDGRYERIEIGYRLGAEHRRAYRRIG